MSGTTQKLAGVAHVALVQMEFLCLNFTVVVQTPLVLKLHNFHPKTSSFYIRCFRYCSIPFSLPDPTISIQNLHSNNISSWGFLFRPLSLSNETTKLTKQIFEYAGHHTNLNSNVGTKMKMKWIHSDIINMYAIQARCVVTDQIKFSKIICNKLHQNKIRWPWLFKGTNTGRIFGVNYCNTWYYYITPVLEQNT